MSELPGIYGMSWTTNTTAPSVIIDADLPYPPSTNHAYRAIPSTSRKTGKPIARVILSRGARAWKDAAGMALMAQGARRFVPPHVHGLRLTIQLYPPDRRERRDGDNTLKLAQDVIARWLGIDDSIIGTVTICRMAPEPPKGRCHVLLEAIPEIGNGPQASPASRGRP